MDVTALERDLLDLAERMTAPLPRECLDCYLQRMLTAHGCAGHRFTRRWARDRSRGTPDGLVRWASQRGGCCCDCEVVMNSLRAVRSAARRGGVLCAAAVARRAADERWSDEGEDDEEDEDGGVPVAGCSGVG